MISKGQNEIISKYIPTSKNSVVKDFWIQNDFTESDNKLDCVTYEK
jgi:predicted enzyme involved in methoxymalonyl-ACP biosynthesis